MRIDKIHLREVGPFDDVEIEFPLGTNPEAADVYLLTGPNGCGKSTILYAIADLLSSGRQRLVQDRLRTSTACVSLAAEHHRLAAAWHVADGEERHQIDSRWGGLLHRSSVVEPIAYFTPLGANYDYPRQAESFRVELPKATQVRFNWAAFAYAGARSLRNARVDVIREPKTNPFDNSLSFFATADSDLLVNWIASQHFKALKARASGRDDRAAQFLQSIRDIEKVVSDILGDTFAFHTSDEDNDIRTRLRGKVLSFALLPDGLVSIVSWVADLLMRLDRIPWVDDIPPMKRSFLLLLDEIDIHLHPAWQRKVLPIVQRMFPNAQIIASTHSPFVVASADDAHIIALDVKDGVASLAKTYPSQRGKSYGAILHSIFGITSDFDTDTEALFEEFRAQRNLVLADPAADRTQLDTLAAQLSERGEELTELVRIELHQISRARRLASAP